MIDPSKITEGGLVYSLGTFDGQRVYYDFSKILIYLEAKGRLMFGKNFKIYDRDRETILRLSNYFIRDFDSCQKQKIDPDKGILLTGPVGCGKTSLMKLMRHIVPHQRQYEVIPARNIAFAFNHIGYKIIEDYGNTQLYCFDDIGVEPLGRYYGRDCNVIGEILLSRHELFQKQKIRTHATTNLNAEELEELYGNRVRSRMRQMFNLIAFDKDAQDKRI